MNPAVTAFLDALEHPRRAQVEEVRALILAADPAIRDEVKWNAPSFRLADHFATFRLHPGHRVQLVLHTGARKHPEPVAMHIDDPAGLLAWVTPDRAVVTLADTDIPVDAMHHIIRQWVAQVPTAPTDDLPRMAAPARRALATAGITTLADLTRCTEQEVAGLHGMGPKALGLLREAMQERGMMFAAGGQTHPR
ncbi:MULTISPECIES: DUF1801 domain-containing protein [Deinococcus]|uniref:DUF1801 domain-containing protein n=1 Tax=Deinococcus rufus TaxID=2136097 RepID=A0ABV7Z7A8_9DEIO|nr:DUF1801 domain-containing protein [Deinococcus sp. AB2017081]WQE95477.1 DUF1801 domain-containing protein [Deinococcus sp. AB2017081]